MIRGHYLVFFIVVCASFFIGTMDAYADKGVIIKDYQLEGSTQLHDGEAVKLLNETVDQYQIRTDKGVFKVPKDVVLLTAYEQGLSFSVVEEKVDMYIEPSIFSNRIQSLRGGERIHRTSKQEESGEWVKVVSPTKIEGWVLKKQLIENMNATTIYTPAFVTKEIAINQHKFDFAEQVDIVDYKNGSYQVLIDDQYYVFDKSLLSFERPVRSDTEGKETKFTTSDVDPTDIPSVINFAKKELDKPYLWGAIGPDSFDCSGLIYYAYKEVGIDLPRTSKEQSKVGQRISKTELKPGDLLFYDTDGTGVSHVSMYIGGGKMIQSSNAGVNISDVDRKYWADRYLFAKRITS